MSMTMASRGGSKAEINVTPMIDVLLVLLIIFMIVAPLTPKGLRASLPAPAAPDLAVRMQDVVVTVLGDAVLLNHERLSITDLALRLARLYSLRGDTTIFVRGDKGLEFRQVAQALDVIHGAGMTRVALMTAN